ncbi:permease prefix domain 1-containing protein [Humibacter sp. RRB41]|uniref:permease prefix domain 1-containing protein n=1 Tax=Humibacter sp. RRB41 TaxID=2919946 RepID=UPI001FAB17F2|nr:permease prefix domain 1-containing protein [Humibacter sp. RRB41]
MSGRDNTELDARLDEAFRRLPETDDLLDLKNELRASLVARADELEAGGSGPTAAVATAFAELGDIGAIAAEVIGNGSGREAPASSAEERTQGQRAIELMRRHKVRPKPAFVVRTVILAVVTAAGLALTALAAFGILGWPVWASVIVAVVVLAAPAGVLVGDGTHQETTSNFPVPGGRAAAYGTAAFLAAAGLALGALFARDLSQTWLIVVAASLLVVAIAWFSYLGATQTNRKKPWTRALREHYQGTDRFSRDEAAAARFGIYAAVIMIVAVALFIVLSFTVGFVWSWLALVGGIVVFFLVLARMLFAPESTHTPSNSDNNKGAGHE